MNLKEKVGGLPVWAWGALVGGVVVVWMWVSQRGTSSSTTTTTEDGEYGTVNGIGSWSSVYDKVSGQTTTDTTTTPDANAPDDERSNTWWLTQAMLNATSLGTSPLAAQSALQKYMAGATLSTSEAAIVNAAVKKYGIPPQGVSDIPSIAPTTPAATTPAKTTVTATPGRYVTIDGAGATIYRMESNGTLTPYSIATWSALRNTPAGAKIKVENLTGNAAATAKRAAKNPKI